MSDPNEPYPLAEQEHKPPTPPAPPAPSAAPTPAPASSPAVPQNAAEQSKSADLKARLNLSGLLENFEEDADFDKDPELESKITGKPLGGGGVVAVTGPPRPEFIKPLGGQAKHWGIAGAVLVLGAAIAAAVNGKDHRAAVVLFTVYSALLHTGTGMVALYLASRLLENRFGSIEAAASRMFTCVAIFMLVRGLRLGPFGPNWEALNNSFTIIVAMAGYVLAVAAIFKLWDKQKLGFVVGLHLMLWLVMELGMVLSAVVNAAPAKV